MLSSLGPVTVYLHCSSSAVGVFGKASWQVLVMLERVQLLGHISLGLVAQSEIPDSGSTSDHVLLTASSLLKLPLNTRREFRSLLKSSPQACWWPARR